MYEILQSQYTETLMKRVRAFMKEGFVPSGGVSFAELEDGRFVYVQAVWKPLH